MFDFVAAAYLERSCLQVASRLEGAAASQRSALDELSGTGSGAAHDAVGAEVTQQTRRLQELADDLRLTASRVQLSAQLAHADLRTTPSAS